MSRSLSLVESLVLGLLVERPRHGFSLVKELSPDGELGRIWSVPNPMVYRAVRVLQAEALVTADAPQSSPRGPTRVLLRTSPAGRHHVRRWLDTPVEHFRDVRSELQLKLALTVRLGRDPRPLLQAQRTAFRELQAAITGRLPVHPGEPGYLMWLWRQESAEATMRFLDRALATESASLSG
jgi:PadR family transcriptional regulator AphA